MIEFFQFEHFIDFEKVKTLTLIEIAQFRLLIIIIFHSVYFPNPGQSDAAIAHIGGIIQPSGPATGPQGTWSLGQFIGQNAGQLPLPKIKLKFSILTLYTL